MQVGPPGFWVEPGNPGRNPRTGVEGSFEEHEREFLTRLLDYAEIKPALLTKDERLAAKIETHPGLLWKTLNVRKSRQR